ncbi:MAG: hypothetical protein AB1603_07830 [Chloroflexota bacterium]
MRKILKDSIVIGFLDEANKITSKDSFLLGLNQSGVPLCTAVGKRGKVLSVSVDQKKRVFPGSPDYVISLKRYLEEHGYTLQLMGDML